MDKKKILIADDHEMFRDGIISLLQGNPAFEIIGQATDGLEVLDFIKNKKFDLVLLDINMPNMNGIEVCNLLSNKHPDIKIIMLSMYNDSKHIQEVMRAGAHGYLLKDSSKKDLLEGIEAVLNGNSYYVDDVKEKLIQSFQNNSIVGEIKLTQKELMILDLICQDLTTQQIAQKLHISTHTVDSHRRNLLAKTGAKSPIGLVRYALDNGLFES